MDAGSVRHIEQFPIESTHPPGSMIKSISLVFDEGTDTANNDTQGVGLTVVDNIFINGVLITRGDGNATGAAMDTATTNVIVIEGVCRGKSDKLLAFSLTRAIGVSVRRYLAVGRPRCLNSSPWRGSFVHPLSKKYGWKSQRCRRARAANFTGGSL